MTEAKERMAAMRDRKAAQGLVRKELWIHKSREKEFNKLKERLLEPKEKL